MTKEERTEEARRVDQAAAAIVKNENGLVPQNEDKRYYVRLADILPAEYTNDEGKRRPVTVEAWRRLTEKVCRRTGYYVVVIDLDSARQWEKFYLGCLFVRPTVAVKRPAEKVPYIILDGEKHFVTEAYFEPGSYERYQWMKTELNKIYETGFGPGYKG